MRINDNQQQLNFKGISNVVSHIYQNSEFQTSIIAAKLDNIGEKDLDQFIEYKKALGFKDIFSNTITIISSKLIPDDVNITRINLEILILGKALLNMSQYPSSSLEGKEYSNTIRKNLKSYTYLANLTKNLMNTNNINSDNTIKEVYIELYKKLLNLIGNQKETFSYMHEIIYPQKEVAPQKIAKIINDNLTQNMETFFDIKKA